MDLDHITKLFLMLCAMLLYANAEIFPVETEDKSAAPEMVNLEKEATAHLGFIQAFVGALSVIVVSELGDKTFFIAAIMAMNHPRIMVFLGAILALALMTVLSVSFSVAFGWIATIIPKQIVYYVSTVLFFIFGIKLIIDGLKMKANVAQEELEEVQADLRKRDEEFEKEALHKVKDVENGISSDPNSKIKVIKVLSHIVLQAFTMTFVAEWGDRSQLTTIILAARDNVYGVTLGGIFGHCICTGIAVIGGRFIAQKISIKTVTIAGGVVFIIFAIMTFFYEGEY